MAHGIVRSIAVAAAMGVHVFGCSAEHGSSSEESGIHPVELLNGDASCSFSDQEGAVCMEASYLSPSAADLEDFQKTCTRYKGAFVARPCSDLGTSGRCVMSGSTGTFAIYFLIEDTSKAQAQCRTYGGTWTR